MILCLADPLNADELTAIRKCLARGTFADGQRTAGWHAKLVKNNRQLESGPIAREAGEIVRAALLRNDVFRAGVLPHSLRPPMFARAGVGEGYGAHVDDALMAQRPHLRSDVSVTVFLSAPESYGGGELVIDTTGGEQSFKLSAGSAVIYPSTSLHRVEAITSGERDVAVTWVQSLVRSSEKREILFDLDCARRAIFRQHGKTAEFDLVSKSHANLLRLWAET
jgi:PKHD-type hydroxylase